MDYIIIVVLVLFSGLFSGLTLSLLSLDKNELKRKISLGNNDAKKVYAVRKKGNLLLCTLLLGNVGVNSTLAIFLGNISTGIVAGVLATGLIVIFGEIIPQASFSRYAMHIGAKTAWIVKIFIVVLFPVCWPISYILDKILGEEITTVYSKKELMKIIKEHEGSDESEIDEDEERIIKGALSFSDKKVEEIMTPRTVLFSLETDELLSKILLNKIKKEGFTRIPVYKDTIDNIVGILYSKDLINIKLGVKVGSVCRKVDILIVSKKQKLDILLNMFIGSKVHLAFVKNEYHELDGVVSLEDVIEEIIKQEIVDESDQTVDLRKKAREKVYKNL